MKTLKSPISITLPQHNPCATGLPLWSDGLYQMSKQQKCSICGSDHLVRKSPFEGVYWCRKHRWRFKEFGATDLPVKIKKECYVCGSTEYLALTPDKTKYWCRLHYRRYQKYGSFEIPDPPKKVCSVCGETSKAMYTAHDGSGFWCIKHYARYMNTGTTELRPRETNTNVCSVCGKPDPRLYIALDGSGHWCPSHYNRYVTHGSVAYRTKQDPNPIVIFDDYAEIHICDGMSSVLAKSKIDKEDIPFATKYKWNINDKGYLITTYAKKTLRYHRLLLNPPAHLVVDHINHDPLDNRKENLRIVTPLINNRNRKGATTRSKTNHLGVYHYPDNGFYIAKITLSRGRTKEKRCRTLEEAIDARKFLEQKYWNNG